MNDKPADQKMRKSKILTRVPLFYAEKTKNIISIISYLFADVFSIQSPALNVGSKTFFITTSSEIGQPLVL